MRVKLHTRVCRKEIEMLSVKELSKRVNIPYTTAVKYLKALQERGFVRVKREGKRVLYPDEAEEMLRQLVDLVRSGISFSQALERLARGEIPIKDPVLEELRRLRQEIEELKKENRALRDLVQMYLSEVKGLPAPKKPWWKRLFGIK